MDSLQLSWLGLPRIELKGRPVKLETRKGVALMAYLSMGGTRQQREIAATMFWPEGDQHRALASLRRTLSSLNSRLPGWIEADREIISLKPGSKLWIDVAQFDGLLERVRQHCSDGREPCDECRKVLEEALPLYRGDFLEGLIVGDAPQFDDWQFFQRERLRQELAEVLERVTLACTRSNQLQQAVAYAQRWTALDPLNERAARGLMTAYALAGQRNAALRHFEELEHRLRDQREQAPEDETCRLFQQLRMPSNQSLERQSAESTSGFPLLKTKLYIPAPPPASVLRLELVSRLDQVGQKILTLVSAPPGFGKTTLLAQWIARTSLPVAWLSLDAADNAPYQFLAYMVSALQSLSEEIGTQAQQMLLSHRLPPAGNILTSVLNDLGAYGRPCVLILDDYQFITEHGVHELLSYMLDHPAANVHIVISTRADPPLQLGRLRATAQMLEVRTRDLRFTPDESTRFLNTTMGLGLSADSVDALHARTEGWAVGLQMAALSLKDHENAERFIRDFSGSHRYVLDYLVEEVLKAQPARVQTFLVQTSILGKLCGGLCDAVMDADWRQAGESAQSMLEYLEKNNLFVIRLDDHRQWYRYHHLFADLLRSRMAQAPRGQVSQLHLRASSWHEAHNLPTEAIDHALAAQDKAKAIDLIERHAGDLIFTGGYFTVLDWLHKLAPSEVQARPWLSLWSAWGTLASGRTEGVETSIRFAEKDPEAAANSGDLAGTRRKLELFQEILAVRTSLAAMQGDHLQTIKLAQDALARLPADDVRHRVNVLFPQGNAFYALGRLEEAQSAYHDVMALAARREYLLRHILACHKLASISTIMGDLRQAHALYMDVLGRVEELGLQDAFGTNYLYLGLGSLHHEWNHASEAWAMTERGVTLGQRTAVPMIMADGCNFMLRLLIAAGDLETAEAMIREADGLVHAGASLPETREMLEVNRVRLWLAQGDLASAATWGLDRLRSGAAGSCFEREPGDIALARVLLAQGAHREARELLNSLERSALAGGRRGRLLEVLLLLARVCQLEGRLSEAMGILDRSLKLGQTSGWIRTYVDERTWLAGFLGMRQEAGSPSASGSAAYVAQLREAMLQHSNLMATRMPE